MARTKKTAQIQPLVEYANMQLQRTDEYATTDFKSGICAFIERILLDTGTYNGYTYIDNNDCEFGTHGYFSRKYYSNIKQTSEKQPI